MALYVLRRIVILIPTLIAVTMILFLMSHLVPGGPFAALLHQKNIHLSYVLQLERQNHLLDPWPTQYWYWITGLLSGHWGRSFVTHQRVLTEISTRIGPTALLMSTSIVLTIAMAVPMGVLQALRQYSVVDYILTFVAYLGLSLPTFFLGILLLLLFAVLIPIFPTGGMLTPLAPFSLGDLLWHLTLPAFSLAFVSIAGYSRFMRAQMLEVVSQDYVRTAVAKGVRQRRVVWKHAFRNALIPVVTLLALSMSVIFSGAIVTENIFSWPGMGTLILNALEQQDYNVIMDTIAISAALVLLFNLVADVMYAVIDPRIQYS